MSWKELLQNCIHQYTVVNGKRPKSARIPEEAHKSIFDREEQRHPTWLDDVRVYYRPKGYEDRVIYLLPEDAPIINYEHLIFIPLGE